MTYLPICGKIYLSQVGRFFLIIKEHDEIVTRASDQLTLMEGRVFTHRVALYGSQPSADNSDGSPRVILHGLEETLEVLKETLDYIERKES